MRKFCSERRQCGDELPEKATFLESYRPLDEERIALVL